MGDRAFGIAELADIAIVAVLAWVAIRYFRQGRARPALLGLAALALVYAAARWLHLELTATLFRGFFAVLVLVVVVVFQEELRRLFEQLGAALTGLRTRSGPSADDFDLLARAVSRLMSSRTGALVVLPGREPMERHLDGGIVLRGRLSEPLLLSLFDASSPGHDGAIVLRNGVVERFAVHLPLSSDHAQIGAGGTRHAAALGLSERCDALCVVVSEERGTVSVAHAGELRVLGGADELLAVLRDFRPAPGAAGITRWRSPRPWIEAAMALGIAVLLWWAVIVGSTEVTRTVAAPVRIENLPRDLVLDAVEPSTLEVTLSGNRRDLLLGTATPVEVRVDAFLAKLGRRTFEIEARQVERPPGTEVLGIEPARIRIEVSTATPVAGQQ